VRLIRGGQRRLIHACVALAVASCSSPPAIPTPTPAPVTLADATPPDNSDTYRSAGFLVGAGAIPFVGMVRYAATEFLDSTAVVIALSVPPRSLSFVRAGDRYAAYYAMRIDVLRGDAIVRSERPNGEVRVASFAETTRGEEGVIFQRTLRMSPGTYVLRVTAQDSLGTGTGTANATITVPSMSNGVVAPIMPVFMAEPRQARNAPLAIVANPRATVRYGRDSLLELYVESYGPAAPDSLVITAHAIGARDTLAADTVVTSRALAIRSGRATLPVYRLGLGQIEVMLSRGDGHPLDSLTAMVNLAVDMPVNSVPELIDALRYFASDADIQRLRSASPAARPGVWAALVRRTDPNQATPDNEALLEYARRLRVAERLFREGTKHGWQTSRGSVVAALGEPDYMTEPQPADTLGSSKVITWEYRRHRLYLNFTDLDGPPGTWRLTPLSEQDFRALVALAGPCVGCR
jgi:GWxTD domain-containing protein